MEHTLQIILYLFILSFIHLDIFYNYFIIIFNCVKKKKEISYTFFVQVILTRHIWNTISVKNNFC